MQWRTRLVALIGLVGLTVFGAACDSSPASPQAPVVAGHVTLLPVVAVPGYTV